MNKNEVRKNLLKVRMSLNPEAVKENSEAIVSRIISCREYQSAKSLMIYVDFRNEVQTGNLILHALKDGKKVSVPITDVQGKRLTPSRLFHYPGDLEPGAWGILEPRKDRVHPVDPEDLDMIIVPGVAFDDGGNRLGYGGGFYDRFLPRTRPGTLYLAPVFEIQIVNDALPGPWDIPMHVIVTEERVIKAVKKV